MSVARAGVEASAVQLAEATIISPLQGVCRPARLDQIVQAVAGQPGWSGLLSRQREDQRVGGPFSSAPSLFCGVPNVAMFQTFYSLVMKLSGISEDTVNVVLGSSGGGSHNFRFTPNGLPQNSERPHLSDGNACVLGSVDISSSFPRKRKSSGRNRKQSLPFLHITTYGFRLKAGIMGRGFKMSTLPSA